MIYLVCFEHYYFAYLHECVSHMCSAMRSDKAIRSHRIGVKDCCKLPCGYCEPTLHPLQEHQMFLSTENFLQTED